MFVVTGGGRGIGRALANALAQRGKAVLIVGRHEEELRETQSSSSLIDYVCADVSLLKGRQIIADYVQDVPVLEGLVHNAGIIEPILPITDIDESSWNQCLRTNVNAPLFLTQILYQKLVGARVLNISSGAAHFPVAGWAAYCVSKAALSMLTQSFQIELPEVAVASVMPGIIDTSMQARIRNSVSMNPDKLDFFKNLKQNNQLLTPETVALFLCWLLLDIEPSVFTAKEWDIYDSSHHAAWLKPPFTVPVWER